MSKGKVVEKSDVKVTLRVHSQESATIHRGNGLPFITDKTVNAVLWLKEKKYEEKEIAIIGEKPATWDAVFNPPKAEEPTVTPEPAVTPEPVKEEPAAEPVQ